MIEFLQQTFGPWYLYIKFVHVFVVMIWGFSAIGGFWYLIVAARESAGDRENSELRRRREWAQWHFNNVVVLEHIAFPLVLLTGFLLFFASGWTLDTPWLFYKLLIVILIFVPLEILDTWLSHWHSPKAIRNKDDDPEGYRNAMKLHGRFLDISSWIVLLLIPLVIFLAITKLA